LVADETTPAGAAVSSVDELAQLAVREPDTLLVIVGPTGSGKSDLALDLAERVGGEIIGADSVQVYRYFDIGSSKPTLAERARVRHHLVDEIEPHEPFDAARFAQRADAAIADVRARRRRPIVCGGTFLWLKALTEGLSGAPPANAGLRAVHQRTAREQGNEALHLQLAAVDPESATRLHPNDVVRVSRALEVYAASGRTMTDWRREHGFASARYPTLLVAPHVTGEELDRRIPARVRRWLDAGWVKEVRELRARGFGDTRAMGAVGYREVAQHLDGRIAETELALAIERATRVYARRQRTWLRDRSVLRISRGDTG
jgi:tRNA dimethylallyltransferase